MDIQLLLIFIGLNVINVIVQTIKSIATISCGKVGAAIINAIAYGLYTVVTVYMLCELPLFWKALIVALCNLVGVFLVKWMQEKARKDKLWKIEVTVPTQYLETIDRQLGDIPHSYIRFSDKHTLFNFYSATAKESDKIKKVCDRYQPKYFIAESKSF